ncbi:MAG: site-2 protease family protein [Planctomycetota bacterium]|nr:site-2 protease family protein [Planctomycetota bacterium]
MPIPVNTPFVPTLWGMNGWWVSNVLETQGWAALLAWVVWVIGSICLHELGHGVAAIREGDETPRESGHMTLNPLVHMPPMSLLFFAVIGFAWGLMPVNPSRFRSGWRGVATVAFAGPLVNIVLAIVATALWYAWIWFGPRTEPLFGNLQHGLAMGIYLNVFLAMFNLIPIPPLDGSRVAMGLVPGTRRFYADPRVQQYSFFALLAVFLLGLDDVMSNAASQVMFRMQALAAQIAGIPADLLP